MSHIRSSPARHVPYTPMNDDDLRRQGSRLYKETGTIMVRPEGLETIWTANT